jgi:tetratricopeptide (TPR) repeat protein
LHDKRGEATRRGNHGWFLLTTGRIQRAISALEHALRMSKENGLTLQAAVQTNNIGVAQYEQGDYQRALTYQDQALAMLESQPNAYWQTIFQTSKANTLLAAGQHDEAKTLFTAILAQAHQDNNIEGVIRAQSGLGHLALERNDFAEAERQFAEVITLARRANMRRLLAEALKLRSRVEAAQGLDNRAEKSWEEAQKLFTILHAPQAKEQPAWLTRQHAARF